MIDQVSDLMTSNKIKEARIAVADYTLTNLRRAIIVSVAVERQLNSSRPEPTASPISTTATPLPKTTAAKRNADFIEDEFIDLFEPIVANRE